MADGDYLAMVYGVLAAATLVVAAVVGTTTTGRAGDVATAEAADRQEAQEIVVALAVAAS